MKAPCLCTNLKRKMIYEPLKHSRKSIRLKEYDYSQTGVYFITICTYKKKCLFGDIKDGEMQLNKYGQISIECWKEIPVYFSNTMLDNFVIMPNHIHGIIVIIDNDGMIKNCRGMPCPYK